MYMHACMCRLKGCACAYTCIYIYVYLIYIHTCMFVTYMYNTGGETIRLLTKRVFLRINSDPDFRVLGVLQGFRVSSDRLQATTVTMRLEGLGLGFRV